MANKDDRYSDNAPGKFYVDTQCIDCDVCRVTAPNNFGREEEKGYSFVTKQAETPEEEAQCQEAMDSCPVERSGTTGSSAAHLQSRAAASPPPSAPSAARAW
ncbi:MAG: ferredoxin [Holophagales bacterium]|nr:ferredoxin [Holophagales bacterium]